MTWKPELDELARRQAFAKAMGGPDKVQRQHDNGKLTVRERVEQLVDAGSFVEVGGLAGLEGAVGGCEAEGAGRLRRLYHRDNRRATRRQGDP